MLVGKRGSPIFLRLVQFLLKPREDPGHLLIDLFASRDGPVPLEARQRNGQTDPQAVLQCLKEVQEAIELGLGVLEAQEHS